MADGIRRNSRGSETEASRASPALPARLEDRIRTLEGLPQLAEHVDRCRSEARVAGYRPAAHPRSKDRDYQVWPRRIGWR